MFDLIGIIFSFIVNILPQQFSLQITRTLDCLDIEFCRTFKLLDACIKQVDFVLACVCTVIDYLDHRRRHSMGRAKYHGTRRTIT